MSKETIPLSSQDITDKEIDAVTAVLRSVRLSLGPRVVAFEQAIAARAGRKYGIGVNSGTSGLHLCMLAYGIGPGDEVITTPFSFISTTNCVLMVGAQPVFVDIEGDTFNLDVSKIAGAITDRTKAIMVVHLFGQMAPMAAVMESCPQPAHRVDITPS